MTAVAGGRVPVLPSLRYTCGRCGIEISHPSDTGLVHKIALQHNNLVHNRRQYGEVAIRWDGIMDFDTATRLLEELCETFKGTVDFWVDELEASYDNRSHRSHDPEGLIYEVMEVVARHAGTELEVITR